MSVSTVIQGLQFGMEDGKYLYKVIFIHEHYFTINCVYIFRILHNKFSHYACATTNMWLPWWLSSEESACRCKRRRFNPWGRKIPWTWKQQPTQYSWRRQWHPTSVLLTGKSHGWRSLVGCSPRGREESDTTE